MTMEMIIQGEIRPTLSQTLGSWSVSLNLWYLTTYNEVGNHREETTPAAAVTLEGTCGIGREGSLRVLRESHPKSEEGKAIPLLSVVRRLWT